MYMAPITRAVGRGMPPPAPAAMRRLAGVVLLLAVVPVMAAWLALQAVVATVVLGARAAVQAIDYAGTVALGR